MTKRVRTMFLTYEAEDDDADTFMVVVGSIAENFRGIRLVEYQDDTILSDDDDEFDLISAMHAITTKDEHLTEEQRKELEDFSKRLNEWRGEL